MRPSAPPRRVRGIGDDEEDASGAASVVGSNGACFIVSSTPEVTRHPWNRSFEWEPHRGPLRRLTVEQAEQFDQLGYVVLEDIFSEEELAPVVEAIDRLESETDKTLSDHVDGRLGIAEKGAITFTSHPVQLDAAARRFAMRRVFADLCHDLVGPDARLYHDQAVYKKPEKPRRFPWHQDNGYEFIEPQQYLTCWVALTDATVDNGCPQVVPGLHLLGTLAHRYVEPLGWEIFQDHPDAVAAPVGKGGIVVFSSLTPHLTGPNLTDDVRKAYILQFAPLGAEALVGDSSSDAPPVRVLADDERRQFAVLINEQPVAGVGAGP